MSSLVTGNQAAIGLTKQNRRENLDIVNLPIENMDIRTGAVLNFNQCTIHITNGSQQLSSQFCMQFFSGRRGNQFATVRLRPISLAINKRLSASCSNISAFNNAGALLATPMLIVTVKFRGLCPAATFWRNLSAY